ncbi:MAG: DUF393 domain-containing protein [Pseudomonadota bacterium]
MVSSTRLPHPAGTPVPRVRQEAPPLSCTVYYNSACPVCDAGIEAQRRRMPGVQVDWIDVHTQPESTEALGTSLASVRERLHLRDAQGQVHVGLDALAWLWAQTPRQRPLAWLARRTAWLGRPAYRCLARWLYRWNRSQGHW